MKLNGTTGATAVVGMVLSASVFAGGDITITSLVKQGDSVPGVGLVTTIESVSVNNSGQWLVEVDTDHGDLNADAVILRNGVVVHRENDSIPGTGGTISSFDSVRINNGGNRGWNLFLRGVATSLDSAVCYNGTKLIQESTISTAPQFSPNTPYIGWFEVRMNDNNQMMMVASVDDPAIATTVDRALVRVDYNVKSNTFTENVLNKEGDILPGQTETIADFGTDPENSSFNNGGKAMFFADLNGSTATDGVIYIDSAKIAQEGDPSPVSGRNYSVLSSTKLMHSNYADYAFKATLSGDTASDTVLIRNGELFMQEGGAPPQVPAVTLTGFGTSAVRISDPGAVIWFGQWSGDTATNVGLFRGNKLLARKGVTTIDGQTVTTIAGSTATSGIADGFSSSSNGKYVIFRGLLDGTTRGAFLIDLSQYCIGDVNQNGTVNVNDLLDVINGWGPCVGCPPDTDSDNTVSVNDLLNVINTWGACP